MKRENKKYVKDIKWYHNNLKVGSVWLYLGIGEGGIPSLYGDLNLTGSWGRYF